MNAEPSTTSAAGAVAVDDARRAARGALPWPEIWAGLVGLSAAAATVALLAGGGAGPGLFVPALCSAVLLLAAGLDAATGRIPNRLTYTAIALGLVANAAIVPLARAAPRVAAHWLGAAGPTQAALGLLVCGGIGVVSLLLAGMGGGDAKLLAATGALLGLSRASDVLICGLGVAVVYSLVNLLLAGRLNATFRAGAVQMLNAIYLRDLTPTVAPSRRTIPLAVPVFLGLLLAHVPRVGSAMAWLHG